MNTTINSLRTVVFAVVIGAPLSSPPSGLQRRRPSGHYSEA